MIQAWHRLVSHMIYFLAVTLIVITLLPQMVRLLKTAVRSRKENLQKSLSLHTLVGNLFLLAAWGSGNEIFSEAASRENRKNYGVGKFSEIVRRYNPAGVILYQWTENLIDASQIRRLTAELQSEAKLSGSLPLIVAVDQEMGRVDRLPDDFTHFSGNMALGISGDYSLAEESALVTGLELSAVGINTVFAPVLDLDDGGSFLGTRTFGAHAAQVSSFGSHQCRGFLASGIVPIVKHFPGHGLFKKDTHLSTGCVEELDLEKISGEDLLPFQNAIEQGIPGIMLAHFGCRVFDPLGRPGTISPPLIEYLRETMGFEKAVVTDAMTMLDTAGSKKSSSEYAIAAIQAGADLIMCPRYPQVVIKAVVKAVKKGKISQRRLLDAVSRSRELREQIRSQSLDQAILSRLFAEIGGTAHQNVAVRLAEKSVRWILAPSNTSFEKIRFLSWDREQLKTVQELFSEVTPVVETALIADPILSEADKNQLEKNVINILLSADSHIDPVKNQVIQKLKEKISAIWLFSLADPFEAKSLPTFDAHLALYDDNISALKRAAQLTKIALDQSVLSAKAVRG